MSRRVLRDRLTSENFLLGGFNFTFVDLNVFPDPLWQRFEGEGLEESGKGRLLPLGVLTGKPEPALRR